MSRARYRAREPKKPKKKAAATQQVAPQATTAGADPKAILRELYKDVFK